MSIFGIIGLSLLVSVFVFILTAIIANFIFDWEFDEWWQKLVLALAIIATIVGGTCGGICATTEDAQIFVAQYEMEKITIENSLESDYISGLERIKLVNKAVELNGELAARKVRYNRWHHVTFDKHVYDDVEFIKFD